MSNAKYVVFTMDVEAFSDTDCLRSSGPQAERDLMDGFDRYMEILDRYGIKSTLFTVGNLAPRISDRLQRCLDRGHRLALHSMDHTVAMDLPPEQFRQQTGAAREALCNLFHTEVTGFRAPCFSIDKERLEILKELGFHYDSSYLGFPLARHTVTLDLGEFQRLRPNVFRQKDFFEFGLSLQRVLGFPFPISGGGYVRLLHWGIMKYLIQRHIHRNDYYVFYLHPFELTAQQIPRIPRLNPRDQYYLHAGIRSYGQKIEQIIQMLRQAGYQFVTFEELTQIIGSEA